MRLLILASFGCLFRLSLSVEPEVNYSKRFFELEYRSLRAYCMSFSEANYFDERARIYERIFHISLIFTTIYGAFAQFQPSWPRGLTMVGFVATLFSGLDRIKVVEWFGESNALRAQKHVNAGAEWLRLYRLASLYRAEYKPQEQENGDVKKQQLDRYKELLDIYAKATAFTPLRQEVYDEYNSVEKVFSRYKSREEQLQEYKEKMGADYVTTRPSCYSAMNQESAYESFQEKTAQHKKGQESSQSKITN